MKNAALSPDGKTITVFIPIEFRWRGGRKRVICPDGTEGWQPPAPRPDNTLIKAVARAHRWKRMLDIGDFGSISQLAQSEGISDRYVARLLRLTLLAPDIIERILDGRLPKGMGLAEFMKPWPRTWEEQRQWLRREL